MIPSRPSKYQVFARDAAAQSPNEVSSAEGCGRNEYRGWRSSAFLHDALRLICRAVSAKVAYDRSETITENEMNIHVSAGPLVSLLAGILILIVPRLLNYIVAIYLIIIGLLGLFGASIPHLR
jgi:hypothetical protein